MRNVLFMSVLLLGTTWVVAQQQYPSPSQSQTSQSQTQTTNPNQAASSGNQTIEGCLSGTNGNYTLTTKDGTAYQLSGNTAQLSAHVGHEMQITGATSQAGSQTSGSSQSSTSSTGSQPSLAVSSFKHISETCSNK